MFPAEFHQLFTATVVGVGHPVAEISKGRVDPQCLFGFFVQHGDNPEFRKTCFTLVRNLNDHQVMLPSKGLKVVIISIIDEIGDHNNDTLSLNRVEGKRDCFG